MASRPHLRLLPASGNPVRIRRPSRRAAGILAAVVAILGLLYLAARETPLFAATTVEVKGAPPAVERQVRAVVEPYVGESLVALDRGALAREIAELPSVRSLRLDRAFPHTIRVSVVPERPLAVVSGEGQAWLVSARGRVIRRVEPDRRSRPVIALPTATRLRPGETVRGRTVKGGLALLRRVPDAFPTPIRTVRVERRAVALRLAGGLELRLGDRADVPLKLEVAARVLRELAPAERRELAYLDVSVPERPVAGRSLNSQVEG